MVSSQPIKRGKKLVVSHPVGTAAAVSKLWSLLTIEIIAYEDEEIICFYIDT